MKLLDFVIIAGVLVITGALAFSVYGDGDSAPVLHVSQGQREWYYPLSENCELEVEGPLGITRVRIEDGLVSVIESACPEKICIRSGYIRDKGGWIACLPNQVFLVIEGSRARAFDSESY